MTNVSLGHSLELRIKQECYHKQTFRLKQLLQLKQELREPYFTDGIRGLEGMKAASQILQERGACGILIGGLAEAVWNLDRTPYDLCVHKDVDVAVLNDDFKLNKKFEGGIDWWLPKSGKFNIKYEYDTIEGIDKIWYENGNGVVLSFGINKINHLNPGLYIPDAEWVITMREYEVMANIDDKVVNVNDNAFDKFRNKLEGSIKK